ncbi:MAG TPA: phosphohistidine phosphatase SixA [Gemmatimonadaceae bacterium]|nr:phosphohistidine phosphatase SixA [Gemmatimonadaceae bacterium]
MQLLVIRHGVAEERDEFAESGQDDALRPLTKEGKWKMERIARALRRVVSSLDVLGSSPLLRATQTASIVASAYGDLEITALPALVPGAPRDTFLAWLRRQRDAAAVAIVGHEPDLGALVTWLLTGEEESHVPLRKGGACFLAIDGRPRAGCALLEWALTPALLRRIGD